MFLRLGRVQTLVVSSAQMAKEVLKTNDVIFCSRPVFTGQQKITYGYKGLILTPYNDYWREMRKICTLHLLTTKRMLSFRADREEEVFLTINEIKSVAASSPEAVVNLNETAMALTSRIICRMAFGKRLGRETDRFHDLLLECQAVLANFYFRDHFPLMGWVDHLNGSIARLEKNFNDMDVFYQELIDEHLNPERSNKVQDDIVDILLQLKNENSCSLGLTFDHIKAIVMDIFLAGTETSASAIVWAMTFLIKNQKALKRAQQEVRNAVGNKGKIDEEDLQNFVYLKAVIKESLRLCPVAPLLVPRETIDVCVLNGYKIPKKTLVYVNAWAIGRDPKYWDDPEEFQPERFLGSGIDYKGTNFELIPFGSGRRGCPGMSLGSTTMELALSNLLYAFDWKLPEGMKGEDVDTVITPGIVLHKKNVLNLIPCCS
ncbi:hypothetical protein OSB04_un000357 [Centaurea solstitialis]|uniref:Cytochrome P450 n=1 Tax=Centaurea solstitialis TaxID=347529 RepID=A0AA38W3Q8_9ASTR|nr:hypothetical protein OSB04_un000357 [Centaurea solstitialis]